MSVKDLVAIGFVTLLLATMTRVSAAEPVFTAVYEGKLSGFNIELTRTLQQLAPGRYRLESTADNLFASMREYSDFEIRDGRWLPLEYVYQRKVFGRKTIERIEFDWPKSRATYTRSNRARDNAQHKLTPGLLDPALYQLALQMQARAQKAPQELDYVFLKRRSVKNYRFKLAEPTTIEVSGKETAAVRYVKVPADETKTSVWLIPERDYVLGRLVHQDGDDVYEVHLRDYAADRESFDEFVRLMSSEA